eukprot:scaffold1912_cov135-Cylindrotheca_fusiformis.AAC.5
MDGPTTASTESIISLLIPIVTIGLVVFVQITFWFPQTPTLPPSSSSSEKEQEEKTSKKKSISSSKNSFGEQQATRETLNGIKKGTDEKQAGITDTSEANNTAKNKISKDQNGDSTTNDMSLQPGNNNWRCACEGGFLPPGMLKTFGSAEAMMRLGTGQCYHKQT